MMNTLLTLIGIFFACEGLANLAYWTGKPTRRLFQVGRILRTALGAILVIIGLVM